MSNDASTEIKKQSVNKKAYLNGGHFLHENIEIGSDVAIIPKKQNYVSSIV